MSQSLRVERGVRDRDLGVDDLDEFLDLGVGGLLDLGVGGVLDLGVGGVVDLIDPADELCLLL